MRQGLPLIEFPEETLDWERIFPVCRPVAVEVGSGKGRFLIRAAESDRGTNWCGLEVRWAHLALGVERIVNRGLDNACYVRCDAMEVVRRFLAPRSVGAFHVYYPDPWWKKRHRKRRVFSPGFIADLARALAPGGELRVATDVQEYFEEIASLVVMSGLFEPRALPEELWSPQGDPLTSYEAKYIQRGRQPNRAAFSRTETPAPAPEPWVSRRPRPAPLASLLLAPRTHRR